jgi:hypothetical protein
MKIIMKNMLLSTVILIQALLLIAGTVTAASNNLDRTIIINGTSETVFPRNGSESNQSAGGYITQIDIYPQFNQTKNWQGFYGNVSGIIALKGLNEKEMYNWSINMTNTTIYATVESTFTNWATFYNANISNLDKLWFDSEIMADTVANTYKTTTGNRTYVNTSLDAYHVQTLAGFDDYVIQSVPDVGTKNDTLWAAVISEPKLNYKNDSSIYSNYELLVPVTNNGTGFGDTQGDTYYFYMEIP